MQTECPFRGGGQRPSCRGADIQSPFSLIASLPKREVHVGQAFFLNLRPTAPTEVPTLRKPGVLVPLSSPRVAPPFPRQAATRPAPPTANTSSRTKFISFPPLKSLLHGTNSPSQTHPRTRPKPIPRKGAIEPQRPRCGAPPRLSFGRSQRNGPATSRVRGLRALPPQCSPHTNCRRNLRAPRC